MLRIVVGLSLAVATLSFAATPDGILALDEREQQIRDRYEQVLTRTPMQDSAFDRVYQSYIEAEGVDAWLTKLAPNGTPTDPGLLVLVGRIYERQFKTDKAIESLEAAQTAGFIAPELDLLLGRLYYENGQDNQAATLLAAALDQPLDAETRASLVRILGNLYLRQGKRDEAIAAWKRLTEDDPADTFAQIELAEIYEDNRMWDEAVAAYTQIADLSDNDPYRKCRALRSIGRAQLQREAYPEAIVAFEQAMDLVAPGNWLFEDLKTRLVNVYQDLGDLEGLVTYVNEKLAMSPGDMEFRDLLAETYTRMTRFEEAEKEHRLILERDPTRTSTHERLIALYERLERVEDVIQTYESLIGHYANEPDYIRRLGEVHLREGNADAAVQVWQRIVDETPTAGQHAQLAGWLEANEFTDKAVAAYEAALALKTDKEWTFRLAGLKHAQGEEDSARTLWTSVLHEESTAAERAEVASVLETFDYFAAAEPLLTQAHAQEAENLEVAYSLARNLVHQDKVDQAVPLFEAMASQSENEYFRDRGEAGLLDAYGKLGVLTEKKADWEAAVVANPDDADLHMRLARMYSRSGDKSGALALFERAVELQPDNSDNLHTLARAYQRSEQTEESIATYRRLIETDGNRAGGYYRELLDIYLKADFKEEAIQTAQKVVEISPSDAEAYLDLGQVYMTYRDYEKGLQAYRTALRLEPDEPNYHRQYGDALQSQDRLGEAQEAYRKMLDTAKEDDTRIQAVTSLANVYIREGKTTLLLTEFQGRVRNTPKRLAAYQELAAIHQQDGELNRSMEVLEEGYNAVEDKGDALKSLVRTSYEAQDYDRVVRYFESLIDLSGSASAYEYERLGKVYVQMGEIEKARSTWKRIVEDEPDDPKAYITYAKALRDGGFYEESSAATEVALEKDPHNYKLRFDYARALAGHEEMGKAYDQLQTLLELGPSEDEEERDRKKEAREKKVERLQRAQLGYQRINMFSPNYRPGRNYYYSSSLRSGSFDAIRPQVIATMAGMAENSIGIDEFIATYESRAKENPDSDVALRDLIEVYQNTNRPEEARKATEALVVLRPDDVDALDSLAVQYSIDQEFDAALEKLAQIEAQQPTRKKANDLARIYLLYRGEKKEEAKALLNQLMEENPDDTQILSMAINVATQFDEKEALVALHARVDTFDEKVRPRILWSLASGFTRTGDTKVASGIYEDILFEDEPDTNRSAYQIPQRNRIRIYTPKHGSNGQSNYYGGGIYRLQNQGVVSSIDRQRMNALESLAKVYEGEEQRALLDRVAEEARKFGMAESTAERDRAWSFGIVLVAYHLSKSEYEEGLASLTPFIEDGIEDIDAYNMANYILEQNEGYEGILQHLSTIRSLYPGKINDILRAETTTLMLAERYDDAAERIRELSRRGTPSQEIVEMVVQLQQDQKPELARSLLEEQLTGLKRNPKALITLAAILADENEFAEAEALAREAWERTAQSTSGASSYRNYGYYRSAGMSIDGNLRSWYSYARQAGKADEVVAEFEARLEKQPGSVSAYEQLAMVYVMADEKDKAIALYQDLSEKRPHYVRAKTALAKLYEQSGKYQDAIAMYESFMKSRPSLYRSMSWEVRRLYQRLGQGEALAEMEEDIVQQARTPDQLQELANRFQQSGDLEKAKELYLRVVKMEPTQSWYRTQLAVVLREMGQDEEALEIFREWFASPLIRSQGYIDQSLLEQMTGQYKSLGRLSELKAEIEEALADKPDDLVNKSVAAHVAMQDHRFEEATALFMEVLKARQDHSIPNVLLQIGEFQGDPIAMIDRLNEGEHLQNFWNQQQLANIYLSAGNREKAMECWKTFAEQQGNWAYSNIMSELRGFGLYEEAEDFYLKNRKKTREMDNIAMDLYMEGHGLEELVTGMLQSEVKGLVKDLVSSLVRDDRTSYAKGLEVLTPLVQREPENVFLLTEIARLHQNNKAPEEALSFLDRALTLNENDEAIRQNYAETLARLDRKEDAMALYTTWVEEKPLINRVMPTIQFYLQQDRFQQATALRDTVSATIDTKDREKLDDMLARHEADQGYARKYADNLREKFEAGPDNETFNAYFRHLLRSGYQEEAYRLCVSQADMGFLTTSIMQDNDLVNAAAHYGSLEAVVDVAWAFIRHGERWERDNLLRNILRSYENVGLGRALLDALYQKAQEEDPPFSGVLAPIGQYYNQLGDKVRALEVLDLLLQDNPTHRDYLDQKGALLRELDRYDEALEITETIGRGTSLREESQAILKRVDLHLNAGDQDNAQTAIAALTDWDKSYQTACAIGIAFSDNKLYEQALPYLEVGMKDGTRRGDTASRLITCYLELQRPDDARRVFEENKDNRAMRSFHRQMDKQRYLPIAEAVLNSHLAKNHADTDALKTLATVLLRNGNTEGALARFRDAVGNLPESKVDEVVREFGTVLAQEAKLVDLLASAQEDPLLSRAFSRGYRALDKAHRNDATREQFLALPLQDADDVIQLAVNMAGDGDSVRATTLYERAMALPDLDSRDQYTALSGLHHAATLDPADPRLLQLLAGHPERLTSIPDLLLFVLENVDNSPVKAWVSALDTQQFSVATRRVYRAILDFYANGKDPTALLELTESATLELRSWNLLATVFERADNHDAEIRVQRRIAEGGFGTNYNDTARARICTLLSESGMTDQALAEFYKISPAYRAGEPLLQGIAETLGEEDLEPIMEQLRKACAEHGGAPVVSDWLGQAAELAEVLETSVDLNAWATEFGLTETQRDEALRWAGLLEDWHLSSILPIEPNAEGDTSGESTLEGMLNESGAPHDIQTWSKLGAKATLGIINLGDPETDDEHVPSEIRRVAATTVLADVDMTIMMSFSCNGAHTEVWINGERAHTARRLERVRPGQERFPVQLKAGENQVVVTSEGPSSGWFFCLGVEPEPQPAHLAVAAVPVIAD